LPPEGDQELLRSAALQTSKTVLALQRQYELELVRSLSLLSAALESVPAALLVFSLEGRVVSASREFAQIWGFDPEGEQAEILAGASALTRAPEDFLKLCSQTGSGLVELVDGRMLEVRVTLHTVLGQPAGLSLWALVAR